MLSKNRKYSQELLPTLLPTLGVPIITLLVSSGNLPIAIVAWIASIAATVIADNLKDKNLGNLVRELQTKSEILQDKLKNFQRQEVLSSELAQLTVKVESLKSDEAELNQKLTDKTKLLNETSGNLTHLQAQYTKLTETVNLLEDKESELKRRIEEINRKNPDLATKERLYRDVEELKQSKASLEAQLKVLEPKVESLEKLQSELIGVEGQLTAKRAQLEELQVKVSDYEKKATELELFRSTYDAIVIDRTEQENRIKTLRPEVEGLELQKQQILQAIRESQIDYLAAERNREEIRRLAVELRNKQEEVAKAEREINQLTGVREAEEREKSRLETEVRNLQRRLRELKQEIDTEEQSADKALQSLSSPLWNNLPQQQKTLSETEFLNGFRSYLQSQGLSFPERIIRAFHTSLKVQDISALVILAGISGTGKSELPQRYADYAGAQKLTLAVQPRWDSPQDLQGFYNYIEKKYKPTDLMRGLYQYQHDNKMKDRLVLVLLDEMNLARVEYYFSDFLSKLETRRAQTTYLDLDVGSLPLPENRRRLAIPAQFLFVGTMNEDETTQSLSDKVLDRANVLTFGKPSALKLREEFTPGNPFSDDKGYVSYTSFRGWLQTPQPNSDLVGKIRSYLDQTNAIMERIGHPFAHRVYQAITAYVVNYPEIYKEEVFKQALADQFGQKLLPKLRGLMLDGSCSEELKKLETIIKDLGDQSLISAFENAQKGRFGQFQWRGLVYGEE